MSFDGHCERQEVTGGRYALPVKIKKSLAHNDYTLN
ncbi:MAG: hypothetical protein ACI80W_001921, partial [Porticoccaceae bacterium]